MNIYLKSVSGDDIYHALEDNISNLRLKPGQMISEDEIANSYHVSCAPVKIALLRLKEKKYIEILPQEGNFVTLLDMQYIKDIIYTRYVLEADVMKTILEQGPYDDLIHELKSNLQKQLMMIEHDDPNPQNFYDIDNQFHCLLSQKAGCTEVWDIIQDCQVYYICFRILNTLTTSRYPQLYQEHIKIYKLLEEKDLEALRGHMYEHPHGNLKVLSQKINDEFRECFIPSDQPRP